MGSPRPEQEFAGHGTAPGCWFESPGGHLHPSRSRPHAVRYEPAELWELHNLLQKSDQLRQNPLSTSPISIRISAARFLAGSESAKFTYSGSSWMRTAPSCIDWRVSRIAGSSSYSTSIKSECLFGNLGSFCCHKCHPVADKADFLIQRERIQWSGNRDLIARRWNTPPGEYPARSTQLRHPARLCALVASIDLISGMGNRAVQYLCAYSISAHFNIGSEGRFSLNKFYRIHFLFRFSNRIKLFRSAES